MPPPYAPQYHNTTSHLPHYLSPQHGIPIYIPGHPSAMFPEALFGTYVAGISSWSSGNISTFIMICLLQRCLQTCVRQVSVSFLHFNIFFIILVLMSWNLSETENCFFYVTTILESLYCLFHANIIFLYNVSFCKCKFKVIPWRSSVCIFKEKTIGCMHS